MKSDPFKFWTPSDYLRTPAFRPSGFPDSAAPGLKDLLFEGYGPNGSMSEVFAYAGYPDSPIPSGGFPGILLLHGGKGTAFPRYVDLWRQAGYAVLAIDWYNRRPVLKNGERTTVDQVPLPGGWRNTVTVNVKNMMLAVSLLSSLPGVDSTKIGIVGLSWGSIYGAILASLDTRPRIIIEIFCGGVVPGRKLTNGRFLHAARTPLFWISGTNDPNISTTAMQDAFDICPAVAGKMLIQNIPHSHDGFSFPVCFRAAAQFLKRGTPLPKLGKIERKKNSVSAEVLSEGKGLQKTFLTYTCDSVPDEYPHWKWLSVPAKRAENVLCAEIPEGTSQCFFTACDEYDARSSSHSCGGSSDILFLERKNCLAQKHL